MQNENALAVRETAVTNATMSVADVLMSEGVWTRANAMGKALMKTSYLGRGTSEFGATMAVITMAKNNMDPVEFSQAYNMINDKPEMKPNYALGLFKRAGGRYRMNRVDEDVCDMDFTAPDGTQGHFVVTMEKMLETGIPWTQDAAGNRILKSNWANHPDDMLFARCTGKALRRVWPEHMGGMHLAGEIDHDDAPAQRKVSRKDVMERVAAAQKSAPDRPANANPAAPASEVVVDAEVVAPEEPERAEERSAEQPTPTVTSSDTVDAEVCPIQGPFFNVRFDEMEPDTLTFLLAPGLPERHPELTPAHVENVRKVLKKFGL